MLYATTRRWRSWRRLGHKGRSPVRDLQGEVLILWGGGKGGQVEWGTEGGSLHNMEATAGLKARRVTPKGLSVCSWRWLVLACCC